MIIHNLMLFRTPHLNLKFVSELQNFAILHKNCYPPRGLTSIISNSAYFQSNIYDYLVMRGGTAGLALASRLAEDPDISVGVLEAGRHITTLMIQTSTSLDYSALS